MWPDRRENGASAVHFAAVVAGTAVLLSVTASMAQNVSPGQSVSLPEVIVRAPQDGPAAEPTTAGSVSGYRALTATSATRTGTPIESIPQTVQVIPRSLIDDQVSLTQSEAIRNIAGSTGMPPEFLNGTNYKLRGFDAERYIDGLPNYIDAGDYTALVNTERIEAVKGPGSLLFQSGGGITGGVINTISKLPEARPFIRAGVTAGGPGLSSPWFDINQPLNAGVKFRTTGRFEHSGDQIDVIEHERYSLYPAVTFTGDASSLTIQGRASRRTNQSYVGLPGAGTLDTSQFSLSRNLYIGPGDIPKSTSENNGITVRFDHAFDDVWSFNAAARYSQIKQEEYLQTYLRLRPDIGTSFLMSNLASPWDAREIAFNANLVARFATDDVKSTLLLAADYDRVDETLSIWAATAGLVNFADPAPVFPAYANPIGTGTAIFNADDANVNAGLVVQAQTTVWERLHILSGLRWAIVDFVGSQPFAGTQYETAEKKLLPRFGVAFDLLPGVTPFAGYSKGLRAVRFFGGSGTPKPEEARQLEAGVKLVLPSGLSATLAAFDITRRNVVSTDPNNPLLQVQTGEQRSRGFDASVIWQPFAGLSILAAYAYIDAKITEDDLLPAGNWLDRVPRHSGRLWANYRIREGMLKTVSIGAGLYAASEQAVNLKNEFFTPGFITFDAKIAYDSKGWSIGVVGKNLTNNRYFIPYPYGQGRVAPGEGLTVLGFAVVRH